MEEKESFEPLTENEILKELKDLTSKKVKLSQILLDPNNSRIRESGTLIVEDERISEEAIQERCLEAMSTYDILNLQKSIRTSGFCIIDRIVLRPLKGYSDKYVVVEGNRRVTALKLLYSNHTKGLLQYKLSEELLKQITEFEVLIYGGNNPQIAWIVQGFRHTPGIKEWEDYPKSVFLNNLEEKEKMPIFTIKKLFPSEKVTDLIRGYCAIEQAKSDEDYGEDIASLEDFGYFTEIILSSGTIKEWAGWKETDNERKFTNEENFKRLLKIIFTDEGKRHKPKKSPTTRYTLSRLVQPEYHELLEKLEEGEMSFEDCYTDIVDEEKKMEPVNISEDIKYIKKAKKVIETLPIAKLQITRQKEEKKQKEELLILMRELIEVLEQQIKNLEAFKYI